MADEIRRVHTEFSAEDKNTVKTIENMTGALGKYELATASASKQSEKHFKKAGKEQSTFFSGMTKKVVIGSAAVIGMTAAYKKFFAEGKKGGGFGGMAVSVGALTGRVKSGTKAMGGMWGVMDKIWGLTVTIGAAKLWGGIFGAGAVGMIYKATRAAEQYQVKLKEVNFVLGSTAAQARMVSDTIVQLGIDTPFSMAESAQAVYYLASSLGDVNKTLSATPAMMDLALAGNMGLAEGSNLLIQTLNMFNEVNGKTRWELQATSRRQADVLTTMQRISPFIMREFAPAFQGASRAISAYNQDLESTLAIMGALKQTMPMQPVMAGFGIDMMIRALSMHRKAYERLTGQSFVTATGESRQLIDMIRAIANRLGLTAANVEVKAQEKEIRRKLQELFPSEYQLAPFLNVIKVGQDRVKAWYGELKNESRGAAASFRDDMINTVQGWKKQLQGSMDTAWTILGRTFQPFQQSMYKGMTKGVNMLIKLLQLPLVNFFVSATIAVTAFGGALLLLGPALLRLKFGLLPLMGKAGAFTISAAVAQLGILLGPGGILGMLGRTAVGGARGLDKILGIAGFEHSLVSIIPLLFRLIKGVGLLFGGMWLLGKLVPELGEVFRGLAERAKILWGGLVDGVKRTIEVFMEGFKKAYSGFNGLGMHIDNSAEALRNFNKAVQDFLSSPAMQGFFEFIRLIGGLAGKAMAVGGRFFGLLLGARLLMPVFKLLFGGKGLLMSGFLLGKGLFTISKGIVGSFISLVKYGKAFLFGQKTCLSIEQQTLKTTQARSALLSKMKAIVTGLGSRTVGIGAGILPAVKTGSVIIHQAILSAFQRGAVIMGVSGATAGVGKGAIGAFAAGRVGKAASVRVAGKAIGAGGFGKGAAVAAGAGAISKVGGAAGAAGIGAGLLKFLGIINFLLMYLFIFWEGAKSLIANFGKLIAKYKGIVIAIGLTVGAIAAWIASIWTGGATAAAAVGLSKGAFAAITGLAVGTGGAGYAAHKLRQRQGEGVPSMQGGGVVLRPGLVHVTHPYERIIPPAKVAPLEAGAGRGDINVNIEVPINGHIIGELPEEFYRTINEKISNIMDEAYNYSYE